MAVDTKNFPRLGFGLMRLPQADGAIDLPQLCSMVDLYMKNGFNYFDTAYVYHQGNSERAIKKSLVERYPRESFQLATKLPSWVMKGAEDRDRIFNEQLERCGVEYFDFYLLHSLEDGPHDWDYEKYDCYNWAMEKKAQGKIRHFGVSFHGSPTLLESTLDKHPEIEFVQIQLNYVDWSSPLIRSGELYEILHRRGVPVIIMEPVKGGRLANLRPELEEMLRAVRPDDTPASWAFRFVGSLDGVLTILSGMSTEAQMAENVRLFQHFEPMTAPERELLARIVEKMLDIPTVECTNCRYCVDGCPMSIRIPEVFRALNTKRQYPWDRRPNMFYEGLVADSGKASACIACGQCESVCPQHLPIIQLLQEAVEKIENEK